MIWERLPKLKKSNSPQTNNGSVIKLVLAYLDLKKKQMNWYIVFCKKKKRL